SGFLGYLNQVESQRLDALTATLAAEYRRHGDWSFVRDNYARLRELAAPAQPVQRLALLAEARRRVVGNPELPEDAAVRPVIVDDRIVGWIGQAPFRRLSSAADLSFQQEQLRAAWIIAGLALALAAFVAIALARAFLLPLKRLAEATHRLSAGAYDTRVEVRSGDELGRLAEDFNRLAQALERNEQLRRRFMADVSHELRTPLAIVKGELEAIEDGVRPLSRESLASLNHEVPAFRNLLENSLRYTDAGGRVRIVARRHAGKMRIVVEDSDPGVPAQAMPHLFERFYRVDGSRSRANGGAGLGLAICRSIVEAHDGEINEIGRA